MFCVKNIKYGSMFILAAYCLIPINFGLNIGLRLNIVTLLVGCFMIMALRYVGKNKCIDPLLKRILIIYAIFAIISSFIAHLFTPYLSEYPRNILAFLVNFFFVGFFLNYLNFDSKLLNAMSNLQFLLSIVVGSYGIYNYLIGFNPYIAFVSMITDSNDMSNVFMDEERGFILGRVSSTFIHPLLLGQTSIVFFTYVLFVEKSKVKKAASLFFWGLMIVLCGSRSALIPLFVVLVIYAFLGVKGKIVKNTTLLLLFIAVGISFIPKDYQETAKGFLFFWDDSYAKETNIKGSSFEMRIGQFDNAFGIIKDNVLFGKGVGYVSQHGDKHPQMLGYESFIFQYIIDGGILGLFTFCSFLFILYMNLLKRCKRRKEYGMAHSLCLGYYLNILFTGIQSGTFIIFIIIYFFTDYHLLVYNRKLKISRNDTQNNSLLLAK